MCSRASMSGTRSGSRCRPRTRTARPRRRRCRPRSSRRHVAAAARPDGCTKTGGTVPVAGIASPARLNIDQTQVSPSTISFGTRSLTARFHISACKGNVEGALVYVTAVPYGMFADAAEQPTGPDGWATLQFHGARRLPGQPEAAAARDVRPCPQGQRRPPRWHLQPPARLVPGHTVGNQSAPRRRSDELRRPPSVFREELGRGREPRPFVRLDRVGPRGLAALTCRHRPRLTLLSQSSGRNPWRSVAGPLGFETRRTPVGRWSRCRRSSRYHRRSGSRSRGSTARGDRWSRARHSACAS